VLRLFSTCAVLILVGPAATLLKAQSIPPYHGPGAEGTHHGGSHRTEWGQGATYGPAGGHYIGGPTQFGPAAPSYWTYNRFSNNGFGGLNWYYGPLGGYTPYVTPYGSTSYGYPYFGTYYNYIPLAPVIRQTRPYWIGGDPFAVGNNPANRPAEPTAVPQAPPPVQPVQPNVKIFGKAPTTESLRRNLRYQAQGDEYFAKQNYLQAYGHYKQAVSAVPARPESRFRLALSLAATSNFGTAVEELKRGMRLDPDLPAHGVPLDDLFGADNVISKNAVLHKVAAWVREDIRDPDRLFLMGVLLHFNDDADKSHTFFEAASALAPIPMYADAFLAVENAQRGQRPVEEPGPGLLLDDGPALEPPAVQPRPAPPVKPAPEAPRPRPLAALQPGAAGPTA